jgi:hypothetical protein
MGHGKAEPFLRHGTRVGLDIHLHEPGEMGLFNVQKIRARTNALT